MKVRIESGKWAWITTPKRGRILRTWGDTTDYYIIIPHVQRMSISTYGSNVIVRFGRVLTIETTLADWEVMEPVILDIVYGICEA